MKTTNIILLFIFFFIIIMGCVSNIPSNNIPNIPSPSSPTLPINPDFLVYRNNTYNFSIEYPANWSKVEGIRDEYSNPPASVKFIVTFYPSDDNRTTQYDCFMVAYDYTMFTDFTLGMYMGPGIKQYYREMDYTNYSSKIVTNLSGYDAGMTEYFYYYNTFINLRGLTYFIFVPKDIRPDTHFNPIICRLVYRTKADTYYNHWDEAQRMYESFKFLNNY